MQVAFGYPDIFQYDTGFCELQQGSDDTMMKLVYEGGLYFLKGRSGAEWSV